MFVSRAFPHRNPSRPAALLNLTIKISQTSQPQYPTPSRARATGPNFHVRFRTMTSSSSPGTDALLQYTACDIADALLALKVPNAGFLPDLHIRAKGASRSFGNVTIAPASTVLMVPKDGSRTEGLPEKNVPAENHWVDLTQPETIVVIQQPKGQICAVLGGIMGLRMSVLKAKGVVVYGRVRDVEQLNKSGLLVGSFTSLRTVVLFVGLTCRFSSQKSRPRNCTFHLSIRVPNY